jgi:hypothetical protein
MAVELQFMILPKLIRILEQKYFIKEKFTKTSGMLTLIRYQRENNGDLGNLLECVAKSQGHYLSHWHR